MLIWEDPKLGQIAPSLTQVRRGVGLQESAGHFYGSHGRPFGSATAVLVDFHHRNGDLPVPHALLRGDTNLVNRNS